MSTPAPHRDITLIAAVARNGVIGSGGGMPWHISEDLRWFRRTTTGHTMVYGRGTYDAMGALPGRRNIVITRSAGWSAPGVEVAHSLPDALELAGDVPEVFVAGGGQVYAEAMARAPRLLVTEVPLEPEGDVRFPPIDPAVWQETDRRAGEQVEWVEYRRRPQSS